MKNNNQYTVVVTKHGSTICIKHVEASDADEAAYDCYVTDDHVDRVHMVFKGHLKSLPFEA